LRVDIRELIEARVSFLCAESVGGNGQGIGERLILSKAQKSALSNTLPAAASAVVCEE